MREHVRVGFVLPEVIDRGDGLVLRCWHVEGAATLGELVGASIEHPRPWMPWIAQEPLKVAERAALFAEWDAARLVGDDAHYGVFVADELVGGCALTTRSAVVASVSATG